MLSIRTRTYVHVRIFLPCYRQQELQFRPLLEDIRVRYYREVRKFIVIPLNFKGVGDAAHASATIFTVCVQY